MYALQTDKFLAPLQQSPVDGEVIGMIFKRVDVEPIKRDVTVIWMDVKLSINITKVCTITCDVLYLYHPFALLTVRIRAHTSCHMHQLKYSMPTFKPGVEETTWTKCHPQIFKVKARRDKGRLHEIEPIGDLGS